VRRERENRKEIGEWWQDSLGRVVVGSMFNVGELD